MSMVTLSVPQPAIRLRPTWFVALISFVSGGSYDFWWYWRSWLELKRARNDARMYPFWHALAMGLPVYGLFRLHAHFRLLNETAEGAAASERVSPGLMVVLAMIRGVIVFVAGIVLLATVLPALLAQPSSGVPPESLGSLLPAGALLPFLLVTWTAFAVGAWQLYRGQTVLNAYYGAKASAPAPRVLALEWVALAFSTLRFVGNLLSSL